MGDTEIIPDGNVDRNSYLTIGTVNEFKFAYAMKAMFRNENGNGIADPRHHGHARQLGRHGILNSTNATAFVNNWDTERSGDSMNVANKTGSVPNDTVGGKRYDFGEHLDAGLPYGDVRAFRL